MTRLTFLKYSVAILLALVVGHFLLSGHAGNRRRHTCAVCRLERIDYMSKLTGTTSTYRESTCSKWYQGNIESSHNHVWVRASTIALLNFYGQTIGIGDNESVPGRVIWRLDPDEQLELYRHFHDPIAARALFVSFTDPDMLVNRRDFAVLGSLREWIDADYSGSWQLPGEAKP